MKMMFWGVCHKQKEGFSGIWQFEVFLRFGYLELIHHNKICLTNDSL
jgi:hypothetical protein